MEDIKKLKLDTETRKLVSSYINKPQGKIHNYFPKYYEKYLEYYKKNITISEINDNHVSQHPFYISARKTSKTHFNIDSKLDDEQKYKDIMNKFPPGMELLYTGVKPSHELSIHSKESYDSDCFTLFSLNEIIDRSENYKYFLDIGMKYAGMGHVLILSYEPYVQQFFFRNDGGSNGYDCEANYKFYSNFKPLSDMNKHEPHFIYKKYTIHKLYSWENIFKVLTN
tara:strand:- start:984 stop:1658 length:675 start_codon:yes stop_codon:yes gene_type:complete